ncbi:MAG: hypothetical protein IMF19_09330 [Proteobacteria bacterium]|nr:hypothetical protein [Pseudomonadota bacterium]
MNIYAGTKNSRIKRNIRCTDASTNRNNNVKKRYRLSLVLSYLSTRNNINGNKRTNNALVDVVHEVYSMNIGDREKQKAVRYATSSFPENSFPSRYANNTPVAPKDSEVIRIIVSISSPMIFENVAKRKGTNEG